MRIGGKLAVVFLLCVAVGGPLTAVQAQQPPADLTLHIDAVDLSAFPRVTLAVTVRDANGVPVPDLDAGAFEVSEDRSPQARPVLGVETRVSPDLPVSIVLVVDVSGSMAGQPLTDAQAAARALVEQLGAQDEVALIAFADAVDLDGLNPAREHPPTTDRRVVAALVDGLVAAGGTPLYDALYKGVLWAEEATLGRRAVILFTDGVDEDPGSAVASAETPIQEATRAGVPVFTIGLGDAIDRGYLERVARATGGTSQETPDSSELTTLFLNVLERLKQQYVITYESQLPGDGQTHRVGVTAEVEGRQASDEAALGPLPLVERTAAEDAAEPPAATDQRGGESEAGREQAGLGWPVIALLGGVGVLALVGLVALVAVRRSRAARQEYCAGCGRPLAPGQPCPDCGSGTRRFRRLGDL